MNPAYVYKARVDTVVDGDTLDLFIDLGFRQWSKQRVRLYGLDTPELRSSDPSQRILAETAQAFVINWIGGHGNYDQYRRWVLIDGMYVAIKSYDGKDFDTGKYGRWIVVVHKLGDTPTESLNDALIREGHAQTKQY